MVSSRTTEHRTAARRAGLSYVTDGERFHKGLTAAAPRKTRPRRSKAKPVAALRRDEVAILQFLHDLV